MSIELFHIIEDGVVILRIKGGIERQAKLYRRSERVYAGHGSGFVRLCPGGGTSSPNITWIDCEGPGVSFGLNRLPKFVGETAQAA